MIEFAVRRDAEEDHAGSTADFQHPAGHQLLNPLCRTRDPLAHLCFRDGIAGITAPPPGGLGVAAMLIGLVPNCPPVINRWSAATIGRDDVSDELLHTCRVRSGHDRTLLHRGMAVQCSLDLARL